MTTALNELHECSIEHRRTPMLIYLAWIGALGGTAKELVDSMWSDENCFCVFLIDHLQGDL